MLVARPCGYDGGVVQILSGLDVVVTLSQGSGKSGLVLQAPKTLSGMCCLIVRADNQGCSRESLGHRIHMFILNLALLLYKGGRLFPSDKTHSLVMKLKPQGVY